MLVSSLRFVLLFVCVVLIHFSDLVGNGVVVYVSAASVTNSILPRVHDKSPASLQVGNEPQSINEKNKFLPWLGKRKRTNAETEIEKDEVSKTDKEAPLTTSETSQSDSTQEDKSSQVVELWRANLPDELRKRKTLKKIQIDDCEVYLLGTSHVSKSSCVDVRLLMKHVQPDCLFLELCSQRVGILDPMEPESSPNTDASPSAPPVKENVKNLQQQGMSKTSALSATLLAKIQSDYADKLGVKIGDEFREAYQAAVEQSAESLKWRQAFNALNAEGAAPGAQSLLVSQSISPSISSMPPCRVVLGDRPVRLTLLRAWESLSIFGKVKIIACLIWSSFKQPSEQELRDWLDSIMNDDSGVDLLTKSMEDVQRHFPTMGTVIITERDRYMFAKLRQMVRTFRAKKVVVVVGAGHCAGICRLAGSNGKPVELGGRGPLVNDAEVDPRCVLASLVTTKKRGVDSDLELQALTTHIVELNVHDGEPDIF